jgi:hypothetical protein
MGMTWARAGCLVLVPDLIGMGERRQHPFATPADYPKPFSASQDYYFRYDLGIQLDLAGSSLMGWFVRDLMRGVDVLLAQPGIDKNKIAVVSEPAGGGDVAGVLAARLLADPDAPIRRLGLSAMAERGDAAAAGPAIEALSDPVSGGGGPPESATCLPRDTSRAIVGRVRLAATPSPAMASRAPTVNHVPKLEPIQSPKVGYRCQSRPYRNDPAMTVKRASTKTTSTNRRRRSSDMTGAPAAPSAAALGCTNTTTTNNEPTQMTPVTM